MRIEYSIIQVEILVIVRAVDPLRTTGRTRFRECRVNEWRLTEKAHVFATLHPLTTPYFLPIPVNIPRSIISVQTEKTEQIV
jgi:hypothetical protein